MALVIILFKPILINLTKNIFSTSIETQELIKTYITVRLFSIPAEFTIYILVGFYLGIQKTNISSLLIVVLSILNIVFSSFFVLSLNLDVFGVALGTLIANYITAIIFILFTYNFIVKKFHIIPKFEKLIIPSKFIKYFTKYIDVITKEATAMTIAFLIS